jgi:hypothetical protein
MRRREFIGLLGGLASTWPMAARAQQLERKLARIGLILNVRSENFDALVEGLPNSGMSTAKRRC